MTWEYLRAEYGNVPIIKNLIAIYQMCGGSMNDDLPGGHIERLVQRSAGETHPEEKG